MLVGWEPGGSASNGGYLCECVNVCERVNVCMPLRLDRLADRVNLSLTSFLEMKPLPGGSIACVFVTA